LALAKLDQVLRGNSTRRTGLKDALSPGVKDFDYIVAGHATVAGNLTVNAMVTSSICGADSGRVFCD